MMLAYLLTLAVLTLLVLGGVLGSRVLNQLRPVLSAKPRLGLTVWLSATAAWAGLFLALGPVVAWLGARQLLPGPVGDVCQRCLAATNPFGGASGPLASVLPAMIFVVVPVLVMAALTARGIFGALRSGRMLRRHGRGLAVVGRQRTDQVWVLPEPQIAAYSIPLGHGRIVLTQGTIDALDETELTAVIAHEQAHLRQRHHALLAWSRILAQVFGWVPLLRAAAPAVAEYAEMSADDVASRTVGDRMTVARALAKLQLLNSAPTAGAHALHAARTHVSSRVRRLLHDPSTPPPSRGWFAALSAYVVTAALLIVTIGTPYMSVAMMGRC